MKSRMLGGGCGLMVENGAEGMGAVKEEPENNSIRVLNSSPEGNKEEMRDKERGDRENAAKGKQQQGGERTGRSGKGMGERERSRSPVSQKSNSPPATTLNLTVARGAFSFSPGAGRTPSPQVPQGNSSGSNSSRTPPSGASYGSNASSLSNSATTTSSSRLVVKIRRFLGTLAQFGTEISPEVGDRLKGLVFNLAGGQIGVEEFIANVQEATSFSLRPFVVPFLRAHLPPLQRELNGAARGAKLSLQAYLEGNEGAVFEIGGGEPSDIFHSEDLSQPGTGTKRKAGDGYENGDISTEHPRYSSTPKRGPQAAPLFSPFLPQEYYGAWAGSPAAAHAHGQDLGGHQNQRSLVGSSGGSGGDEEWRNIHTMLNCILQMVEKTKRALNILHEGRPNSHGQGQGQQGPGQGEPAGDNNNGWLRRPPSTSASFMDAGIEEVVRRQLGEMMTQVLRATEERVAEVKRKAEEAVQDVKRQALLELRRGIAAAEARAMDLVVAERARLERSVLNGASNSTSSNTSNGLLTMTNGIEMGAECCWNCGRKAYETCSGCNRARYCSSFCQHKDWESHHSVCSRKGAHHPHARRSPPTGGNASPPENAGEKAGNGSPPQALRDPIH